MRSRVAALESAIRTMVPLVIEPKHVFAQGLYAREVFLPAGATATGHIHAQEHICIISQGKVQVVTETGVEEITAPATMIVPRGRKNCVHAVEDTVWTTIHATVETDVETIERTLTLPEYPEDVKWLS
jgi:quercetin dioxygenase-like cupin family protein